MAMAEAASAFMQQYAVPGLSVAIGHSGRLIYQDAFGWADRKASEEATPARWAKIAKEARSVGTPPDRRTKNHLVGSIACSGIQSRLQSWASPNSAAATSISWARRP
jgi:hypothetical protein